MHQSTTHVPVIASLGGTLDSFLIAVDRGKASWTAVALEGFHFGALP